MVLFIFLFETATVSSAVTVEETAGQHLSSGSTLTSSLQSTTSNSGNPEAVQEQLTVTEPHSGAEGIPGTIKPLLSGQHGTRGCPQLRKCP